MPEIQTKINLLWKLDSGTPEWIFSGDLDADQKPLTIKSASAVIEVNLHPDSAEGADFHSRPVAWRGVRPSCMGVGKCRGGRSFMITNVNEKNAEHGFRVRVTYQGRTYISPDQTTIINTEPTYRRPRPRRHAAERRFREAALPVV